MTSDRRDKKATYTIGLIPNTDIALFHWVGPITVDDRIKNLDLMVDYYHEKGVTKLIIDGRDQEPQTGAVESYDFGTMVPTAFRGLIVAIVHRPDDETLKFIETVAFNRGSGTNAFVDIH